MQTEQLIDQLVAGLRPVRRRTMRGDALVLGLLLLLGLGIELAGMAVFGVVRPDMPAAAATATFWWKLGSSSALAVLGVCATVLSLQPESLPRLGLPSRLRPGLHGMLLVAALCLAGGWAIDVARSDWPALLQRLDWRSGVECTEQIVMLSLPAALALLVMMRRGASTDANGSAWAAGLAAAGSGAFAFVFSCPYDDPVYVLVWYGLACAVVAVAARLVLPRLTRW